MLPGFRGSFDYNVDDKGRILLPVPFRDLIHERVVLMYGPDGSVSGLDLEGWERIMDRAVKNERDWSPGFRRFVASATEVQKEVSHRISIPPHMLDYAGLQAPSKGLILGMGCRFEIWKPEHHLSWARSNHVSGLLAESARAAGAPELV